MSKLPFLQYIPAAIPSKRRLERSASCPGYTFSTASTRYSEYGSWTSWTSARPKSQLIHKCMTDELESSPTRNKYTRIQTYKHTNVVSSSRFPRVAFPCLVTQNRFWRLWKNYTSSIRASVLGFVVRFTLCIPLVVFSFLVCEMLPFEGTQGDANGGRTSFPVETPCKSPSRIVFHEWMTRLDAQRPWSSLTRQDASNNFDTAKSAEDFQQKIDRFHDWTISAMARRNRKWTVVSRREISPRHSIPTGCKSHSSLLR